MITLIKRLPRTDRIIFWEWCSCAITSCRQGIREQADRYYGFSLEASRACYFQQKMKVPRAAKSCSGDSRLNSQHQGQSRCAAAQGNLLPTKRARQGGTSSNPLSFSYTSACLSLQPKFDASKIMPTRSGVAIYVCRRDFHQVRGVLAGPKRSVMLFFPTSFFVEEFADCTFNYR